MRQVAGQLGQDWDIEIVETHHNQKIDAPSGTALALGRAAADGRNVNLDEVRDSGRDGVTGQRRQGNIGFAVMRGGDVAGEHTVTFFGQQERIELTHGQEAGLSLPVGHLRCCICLCTDPGLYSMDDVLSWLFFKFLQFLNHNANAQRPHSGQPLREGFFCRRHECPDLQLICMMPQVQTAPLLFFCVQLSFFLRPRSGKWFLNGLASLFL